MFMPLLVGMSCVLLISASNFAPYFFFHKVISYHLKKKERRKTMGEYMQERGLGTGKITLTNSGLKAF